MVESLVKWDMGGREYWANYLTKWYSDRTLKTLVYFDMLNSSLNTFPLPFNYTYTKFDTSLQFSMSQSFYRYEIEKLFSNFVPIKVSEIHAYSR